MQGRGTLKDAQRPRSRSSQRRKLKSPLRIKDKIKELEDRMARPMPFKRHKERQPQSPAKESTPNVLRHEETPSPFPKITRQAEIRSSQRPSLFSPARHALPSKRQSGHEGHSLYPVPLPAPKLGRMHSHREMESVREEEGLQRLRAENQKFKQVYSRSQQKMQALEHLLHQIKGQHQSEKCLLQRTIDALQKKIEAKKINLGHLYAYDDKGNNFLLVQDRIIAETDNENSYSSPEAASKGNSHLPRPTPELSNLSLESK